MSDNQALDTFDGLDYEEIEQAVMETSRGRWFLTEFARRHKAADTAVLLDAIRRLEGQIRSMTAEQGHEAPAQADAAAADSKHDVSDYDEIADKLDRTTQLVRRLRSSHKLIGDAADKPLTAPKTAPAKPGAGKPTGDPPGFVGSDDDIFADNNSIVSALQQQAEMPDASPVGSDTLQFADMEATDAGDDEASDKAEPQQASAPSQSDEKPSTAGETIKANGRISVTRPTAANQVQTDDEPAAEPEQPVEEPAAAEQSSAAPEVSGPEEKPKKRIIVIRRPADQPGDIPLADSAPELPDDSPTAA